MSSRARIAAAFDKFVQHIAAQGAAANVAAFAVVVGSSLGHTSMAEHLLAAKVCLVY